MRCQSTRLLCGVGGKSIIGLRFGTTLCQHILPNAWQVHGSKCQPAQLLATRTQQELFWFLGP